MATATLNPPLFDPDFLYEVIDGQIKELPPMGRYANTIASFLVGTLWNFVHPKDLGLVLAETLFRLSTQRSRRPDVAFVAKARLPARVDADGGDPPEFECSPNLAIEVISPSNTALEIETKRHEYFAAGVELVWVVYPNQRTIHVYDSLTTCRILNERDELDGGKVLPGFKVKIADLFS